MGRSRPEWVDRGPPRMAPRRPPRVKIPFTRPHCGDVMGMQVGRGEVVTVDVEEREGKRDGDVDVGLEERWRQRMTDSGALSSA